MKNRSFVWLALLVLSFVVAGCQPAPQAALSRGYSTYSLQEISGVAQLDCLTKIKNELKNNQLKFDTSVEKQLGVNLKAVSAKAAGNFDETDYSYEVSNAGSQVSELSVERTLGAFSVTASLKSVDRESQDWFALSLEAKVRDGNSQKHFSQNFRVSTSCESILNESSYSSILKSETTAEVKTTTLHPGNQAGSLQKKTISYALPTNSVDASILEDANSAAALRRLLTKFEGKELVSVAPGFGVIQLQINANKTAQANDPNLSKIVPFEAFDYKFILDGTEMISGSMNYSTASGAMISIQPESTNFSGLNEAIWSAAVFSRKEIQVNTVQADPTVFSREGLSRIQLSSSTPYSYANLKAYFSEEASDAFDGRFKNHKILVSKASSLPSKAAPLVAEKDRAAHTFLQESPLVQVSNSEVQKLTETVKQFKSDNRVEMALRIAKLVTSTIGYDNGSLTTGQIYPLSTADVLSRKTGVCQHFANLFAAIARGVGLPTKIIVGYSISENAAGGHAWNEIETEPGVWVPVEPQSAALLIPSGKYLPAAESGLLENGSFSTVELKDYGLFRFNYKLLEKTP